VIDSLPKFAASLFLHPHDEVIQIDVLRGTEERKLSIPAMEGQGSAKSLADLIDPQSSLIAALGGFVLDLNKSVMNTLANLRSSSGLVVAGTVDYTPAIDADLAVGDVIRSINGVPLTATSQLRSELERLNAGEPVVLEIEREGAYQFVSFEME
jgi:S1-C subfamily serine protease